jgi:T5SS/PEP-CTERM-associated repeat protein
MSGNFFKPRATSRLVACAILLSGITASAQKIWTNPTSGNWGAGINWSGNTPPSSSSVVYITNANTKTVTIDATTPAANLTIATLRLGAPPGATNTLLLSGAGANNPLVCQVALVLADGAALRVTNSALFADIINSAVDIDGSLTLDSGSITFGDTTVTARVGRATSGRLVINSGTVTAGAVTVGGLTNSSGVINLNGGTLDIATLFSVGRNASTTGSVFMAGGQLIATNDTARIGDSGAGQMTVSNSVVALTNLNVGRDPLSTGILTLQNGASVSLFADLSIARFSGSTGAVFVTGGLLAATNNTIYVGREGSGQMTISNGTAQAASLLVAADFTNTADGMFKMTGGNLDLSSNLVVGGASLSTGRVSVAGGTITVTNPAGTAMVSVPNGGLTLSGGSLTADNLFLTNATGQFVFNGGALNSQNATVANGSPFVVGDGVAAATLHMNGGTLSFANGLIISSNATLNGCGTIIGAIINHGLIATNCAGALAQPTITGVTKAATTNAIAFTTVNGQNYTLEFKNALSDATWTAILPSVTGNGSVMTLIDTTATVPARFYRVRAQ